MSKRGPGKRPAGREARKAKQQKVAPAPVAVYSHTLYGVIPMIEEEFTVAATGEKYSRRVWDPAYQPPLPPGAIRGNIREQVYCCDIPRYFYQDLTRQCVQCRQTFVFEAAEQKFWYEVLKFNSSSSAIRCRSCRRQRRSDRVFRDGLAQAKAAWNREPADGGLCLALAEATVLYRERFDQGDADGAIGVVRQVLKRSPELAECRYWEGRLHETAGRSRQALESYERFLIDVAGRKQYAALVRDVEKRAPRLAGSLLVSDLPGSEATS